MNTTTKKYRIDRHRKESILLDEFGDSYFGQHYEDLVKNYSISLPESLMKIIDRERKICSRSRYIRKLLEMQLRVERD